jgi:hypothetical protein
MASDEQYVKAMCLLASAAEQMEDKPPTESWLREYFELTGDHMVCTEEGWQPGENKEALICDYGEDHILDEVNAPVAEAPHGE